MKKVILIAVVFFFLIACRKDIDKVDKNYVGDWLGTPDTSISTTADKYALLKINSQSNLSYEGYNAIGEHTYNFGGTAKVKGNSIHVKGMLYGHYFTIISPPTQINSPKYHWMMILDGPDGTMPYYR